MRFPANSSHLSCVELARVFPGYATGRFYHLWSRLLRLLSGTVSPPRECCCLQLPMEGDEESIRRTLGLYGTVESVAFRHWPHLPYVSELKSLMQASSRSAICVRPWPYCVGVPPEGQMFPVRARGSPLPKLPPEGWVTCQGRC